MTHTISPELREKVLIYIYRMNPVAYFPNPIPPLTANQEMILQEFMNYLAEQIALAEKKGEEERWCAPCDGCAGGHPSFWKTVVESPQWQQWEKVANSKGFDYDESRECGWLSARHFQEFLKFLLTPDNKQEI